MTVWVEGSSHIVFLPKNVKLGKDCEENNSPTHRKWTFFLDRNYSQQLWRHREKAPTFANTFNRRKTSKKNALYYSLDYFNRQNHLAWDFNATEKDNWKVFQIMFPSKLYEYFENWKFTPGTVLALQIFVPWIIRTLD